MSNVICCIVRIHRSTGSLRRYAPVSAMLLASARVLLAAPQCMQGPHDKTRGQRRRRGTLCAVCRPQRRRTLVPAPPNAKWRRHQSIRCH
eukprot:6182022-Pleurochrysis_carterae.AAC.4